MGIMASDSRTLKLSILADVDDLKKKLGDADSAVAQNSSKMSEFGKKAAAAFAVDEDVLRLDVPVHDTL